MTQCNLNIITFNRNLCKISFLYNFNNHLLFLMQIYFNWSIVRKIQIFLLHWCFSCIILFNLYDIGQEKNTLDTNLIYFIANKNSILLSLEIPMIMILRLGCPQLSIEVQVNMNNSFICTIWNKNSVKLQSTIFFLQGIWIDQSKHPRAPECLDFSIQIP